MMDGGLGNVYAIKEHSSPLMLVIMIMAFNFGFNNVYSFFLVTFLNVIP